MVLAGYDCISCIIDDVVGALLPLVDDDQLRRKVIADSLFYLHHEFDISRVPSVYITAVHRILKQITGIEVPYSNLRRRCNEIGLILAERLKSRLEDRTEFDRFTEYIKWAIAGNELDFRTVGTGYEIDVDQIESRLQKCVDKPLLVNDVESIYDIAQTSHRILYIPDNVGEIAFDLLLVEFFRTWDKEVYFPLRGGAITSDATLEDGMFVGAEKIATDVFQAGPDTLGIILSEASDRLKKELEIADLILCKGQANFYTFSEYKDRYPGAIVSLLRTKCDRVSRYFGLTGKINIASILKRRTNEH